MNRVYIVPSLIPGLTAGIEFIFPTEYSSIKGVVFHLFFFRCMFIWGFDEQQLPSSD